MCRTVAWGNSGPSEPQCSHLSWGIVTLWQRQWVEWKYQHCPAPHTHTPFGPQVCLCIHITFRQGVAQPTQHNLAGPALATCKGRLGSGCPVPASPRWPSCPSLGAQLPQFGDNLFLLGQTSQVRK